MSIKRIVPCLDCDLQVSEGRVVKGVEFKQIKYAGNPVELANKYCEQGADEIVLLDISASKEKRDTMKNLVLPLFGMEIEPFGNYFFSERYIVKNIYEGSIADEIGLSVNDPLILNGWKYDLKKRFAMLRIEVKKRKAGFMESTIQLITSIDSNNLL